MHIVRGSLSAIDLNRGVAQPGRVLRSGRRSRRFESSHPDHSGRFASNSLSRSAWAAVPACCNHGTKSCQPRALATRRSRSDPGRERVQGALPANGWLRQKRVRAPRRCPPSGANYRAGNASLIEVVFGQTDHVGRRFCGSVVAAQTVCAFTASGRAAATGGGGGHGAVRALRRAFAAQREPSARRQAFLQRRTFAPGALTACLRCRPQ